MLVYALDELPNLIWVQGGEVMDVMAVMEHPLSLPSSNGVLIKTLVCGFEGRGAPSALPDNYPRELVALACSMTNFYSVFVAYKLVLKLSLRNACHSTTVVTGFNLPQTNMFEV